jgi:hypothetical protein
MHPLVTIGSLALGAAAVGVARRAARAEAGSALASRLRAVGSVMARARGGPTPDVWRLLQQRPAILLGVVAYELGLVASNRLDGRLKALAGLKTAALVGCPF